MTSCLKMAVIFDWDNFFKTLLNRFQMSNKSSRVTNLISGPFEFFCLFYSFIWGLIFYYIYIMWVTWCYPLRRSVGDNLSIRVWNHTEEKVDRDVSSHIYSLRVQNSDSENLSSDILLIWPGIFGVTSDL